MTKSIAVLVPSRGRPQNIQRLAEAFRDTVANPNNTHLFVGVDNDDPALSEYLAIDPTMVTVLVGPRLRLAGTLNELAEDRASFYDILGFMGDDHLPRTQDWDSRIREEMVPGGVVYGNDLVQGPNLPTEVFLDSAVVRTLGYFVPRGFIHLFLDNTWKTWGEKTGKLRYLDDVIIEHLHPVAGTAETDAGYVEVNAPAIWSADEERYHEYVNSGELDADIEKLRSL